MPSAIDPFKRPLRGIREHMRKRRRNWFNTI